MHRTFGALIILSLAWAFLSPARAASGPAVVVVMARSAGVENISRADLRRAFLGLPTSVGGKRLIPINLPVTHAARHGFDRAILGLDPARVGAFWVDRRIRDESPPPRSVPSVALAGKVAASLPGAITYLPADLLTSNLVALKVDGQQPGSAEYPLQ